MPTSFPVPPSVRARRDRLSELEQEYSPSYTSLKGLADYVVANRDCRTIISYSVVDLLDPTLIPSTGYHPSHKSVLSAMGAIAVISSQARVILSLQASRVELAALLRDHYVEFLSWLHFFSSKGIFIIPGAAFILAVLDVDEDLRHAFMDSPSSIDLVFNMWTQQDERGQYHFPPGGDTACPLLLLIWRVVRTPRGSATFRPRLQTSPSEIQCIADTLQGRLKALRKGYLRGSFSPSFIMGQLRGLSRIIEGLLYQPHHSRLLFHSHGLLKQITLTLSVCLRGQTSSTLWIYASDVLASLYVFIVKSEPHSGSASLKVVSAVQGGLLRVLLGSLLYIPTSHGNYPFAADFLRDIIGDPSALFTQCWEEILHTVQTQDSTDGSRIVFSVCDFIQHSETPSQQREKSRKCSGCHARSYCSIICQKADWDTRHRHECGEMRLSTAVEADLAGELRLCDRAHLAAYVERVCNKHMDGFRSYAQRRFSAPLGSLILAVDAVSIPATGKLFTVVDFFASIKNSFGESIPQQPRINDYLTQMLAVPEIRVAYAIFPLGLLTVHLLVRMRDDGDHILKVVSFTTIGISECRVTDPQHIWSARGLRL